MKFKLFYDYMFDDDTLKLFNIPKIELIDNKNEVWRFCIFDRHPEEIKKCRYMVSNYGRLYDYKEGKMVKVYFSDFFVSSISPYVEAHISVGKKGEKKNVKYLIHRLVALAFLPRDPYRNIVNHIDGNPSHNYLWNLEWTNNSENYIHALKTGLKVDHRGENRSNSIWSDNEVRVICAMMEDGHKATFIYNALLDILPDDDRVQYERVRTLYKHIIRKTHWTHISKDFDIDFTRYNYAKEQMSVKNANVRKELKEGKNKKKSNKNKTQ